MAKSLSELNSGPENSSKPAPGMGLALDDERYIPTGDAGAKWSGQELTYAEFTADVSITTTTEGTANNVVTAAALELDGKPILIEFYTPRSTPGTTWTALALYDNNASIGQVGITFSTKESSFSRRLAPSKGLHVYSVRAWVNAGTGTIHGGAGGSGNFMPGFIRITRS